MNPHAIEFWLIALAITVVLLAGFGVFSRWCSFSPAVKRARLEVLRVGMTMDEVTALLGKARDSRRAEHGGQQWVYGSRLKRHVLFIAFNATGRVLSSNPLLKSGCPQQVCSGGKTNSTPRRSRMRVMF